MGIIVINVKEIIEFMLSKIHVAAEQLHAKIGLQGCIFFSFLTQVCRKAFAFSITGKFSRISIPPEAYIGLYQTSMMGIFCENS